MYMAVQWGIQGNALGTYNWWCTKVLPAVYDDSLSYYEVVCKLADSMAQALKKIEDNLNDYTAIEKAIGDLRAEFEEFKAHGFDDYYAEQVKQWINDHLEWVYLNFVKQVYFGLTTDGYFVAYYPESWEDIVFDTGMVYSLDTYGRLILRWDVDGKPVDQTREHNNFGIL